jgi:hypothetical protein
MKIVKIETIFEDNSNVVIEDIGVLDNIILSEEDYSYWRRSHSYVEK